MNFIQITNWENFQHYKDRRPTWIKLLVEIIDEFDADGNPKKFWKMPDSAKLTFVLLACLRAYYNNHIPYPSEKWLKERLGISSVNLQPLLEAGFIEVNSDSVSEPYQNRIKTVSEPYGNGTPETETETEKETYKKETEIFSIFEKARKLFPGLKRGGQTEFDNLKKKHSDWKSIVEKLEPAIKAEIAFKRELKAKNQFCPAWANFQTWLNQRRWEQEFSGEAKRKETVEQYAERQYAKFKTDHAEFVKTASPESLEVKSKSDPMFARLVRELRGGYAEQQTA